MSESPFPIGCRVIVLNTILERGDSGRTYDGFLLEPDMIGIVVDPWVSSKLDQWKTGRVAVTFPDYGRPNFCWVLARHVELAKNAVCGDCGLAMEDNGDYLCPKCRGSSALDA